MNHPRCWHVGWERTTKSEWRATTRVRPYYGTSLLGPGRVILVRAYPGGRPLSAHTSRLGMIHVMKALYIKFPTYFSLYNKFPLLSIHSEKSSEENWRKVSYFQGCSSLHLLISYLYAYVKIHNRNLGEHIHGCR